jgi:hypothetical protein
LPKSTGETRPDSHSDTKLLSQAGAQLAHEEIGFPQSGKAWMDPFRSQRKNILYPSEQSQNHAHPETVKSTNTIFINSTQTLTNVQVFHTLWISDVKFM